MNLRIFYWWSRIRYSFWFLPALMILSAVLLSWVTLAVDRYLTDGDSSKAWWLYQGGKESALALLSTSASSMITVAGVIFSITIVALTLASSQLGPRLLRNFMKDTGNQVVLGTFIATFSYCVLIMRRVHPEGSLALPQFSVMVAMVLSLLSMAVLVFFIHHVSVSIQADHVIAEVSRDLEKNIRRLYPEEVKEAMEAKDDPEKLFSKGEKENGYSLRAPRSGYIQVVDWDALFEVAVSEDLQIKVHVRAGQYANPDDELATVLPNPELPPSTVAKLRRAFFLGRERTPDQDIEFAVSQLVEIAVRALSPGVNDPFTVMTCIDRLGTALCQILNRKAPSEYRYDEDGRLRLLIHVVTFASVTDVAFNQIRQHGRHLPAIVIRLLQTITLVAKHCEHEAIRAILREHARTIVQGSRKAQLEQKDRRDIQESYRLAMDALMPDTETA